jgi:hypothetical protein
VELACAAAVFAGCTGDLSVREYFAFAGDFRFGACEVWFYAACGVAIGFVHNLRGGFGAFDEFLLRVLCYVFILI